MQKATVIAFLIYICLFSYLPKSTQTTGFIVFIFLSVFLVLKNRKGILLRLSLDTETKKLKKLFITFLTVSAFYLAISFMNLPKFWNINNLMYNMSYIPRHFFIIAELFIPIALGYAIYTKKLLEKINTFFFAILFIVIFFTNPNLCTKGLLLILLALIAWKHDTKYLFLFAFFIFYDQAAYVMGYFAMLFFVAFEKNIVSFLKNNTNRRIFFSFTFTILLIFVLWDVIMEFVLEDKNSLWRLNVWINELNSLYKTYLTGVGFGSAYVTDDILLQTDNYNMFFNNEEGQLEVGVFIVANHSSFLNMFYRMGLIGGVLFLALNFQIISVTIKMYYRATKKMRRLLWYMLSVWIYETVVIALNPGLEMMQFALSYLLSLAVLLAVIWEIQHKRPFTNIEKSLGKYGHTNYCEKQNMI